MSTATQFFGTGSGGGLYHQRWFTSSGTFTCPVKGKYLITAIGGGAAGGHGNSNYQGAGGGAGGIAQSLVLFEKSATITFTVAAAVSGAGTAGGTTSVSATNLSLTANGGAGGSSGIFPFVGGAGGAASGGNIFNHTGGYGTSAAVGAGGVVNIFNLPNANSGSLQPSSFFNDNILSGGRILNPTSATTSWFFPGAAGGNLSGYGCGGQGGGYNGTSGLGGNGLVIIEYFIA